MKEIEDTVVADNEKLFTEWNSFRNIPMLANLVCVKSGKKVWWKCSYGHEWQARVIDRTNGNDCPYCSGKRAVVGVNDLATLNPPIASEWNFDKNGENRPEHYCLHSGKKFGGNVKKDMSGRRL